jgi:hypothetical protein
MKYGSVMLGQVEALINKLGGEDVVKRILADEVVVSITQKAKKLLTLLGTTTVYSDEPFDVDAHFRVNIKYKNLLSGTPSMGYINPTFRQVFGGKVERPPQEEVNLSYHRLQEASVNGPVIKELGFRCLTKLWMIWELLKRQPNGESGTLLANGYANIFYVRDARGALWAVSVDWNADYGYWVVYADSVDSPDRWFVGNQVVSCNSCS